MVKQKLAPAKEYNNRPVEKWTTASFQAYLKDKSFEQFNVTYSPFKGYAAEGKMLKTLIDSHGPEFVKKFIDTTFAEYKPTQDFPGTSFGFMFSYRKNVIQRLEKEASSKEKTMINKNKVDKQADELDIDWI